MPRRYKGEDGRDYIEVSGMAPIAVDDLKDEKKFNKAFGLGARIASNPEVDAGIAGAIGSALAPYSAGTSLLLPAGVGAASSVVRDWVDGERDPLTITGHALTHGAVNAIPGTAMVRGAGKTAAKFVGEAVAGGASKIGLAKALAARLGMDVSERAAPAAVDSFANATIPSGDRLASIPGHRWITQLADTLESRMAATTGETKALLAKQLAHVNQVRNMVRQRILEPTAADLENTMRAYGVGDAAKKAAATAQAAATSTRRNVANVIRALLGTGSAAKDISNDY